MKMIVPVLTKDEYPGLRLQRGLSPFPTVLPLDKPLLICLSAERTDFRLGCCTARGQKGTRYPSSANPLPWSVLASRMLGLLVHESISPFRPCPARAEPSASDGRGHQQGHILLLSTTQGHCPPQMLMDWEASRDTRPLFVPGKCFRLSFSFSWTQLHTSYFPDIMLPFVTVSSTIWGML